MRAPCSSFAAVVLLFAAAFASCDPVNGDARAALGDEAPGVPTGPLHRPGQPCLVCHDGSIGDPPQFTVAGTVYESDGPSPIALANTQVTLTGANGKSFTALTNAVGNFYVTPVDFSPVYPLHVTMLSSAGMTTQMQSHVGREGSCAGCHFDPPAADSPGHVYSNAPAGGVP